MAVRCPQITNNLFQHIVSGVSERPVVYLLCVPTIPVKRIQLLIFSDTQVTPADWKTYALSCKPDIVVALSDVPYTSQPHSQKRTTKSIERSTAWLANFLQEIPSPNAETRPSSPDVLVNLVGGLDPRARTVFSEGLVEALRGREQEQIRPLNNLDEGVSGYIIDLLPLRLSRGLEALQPTAQHAQPTPEAFVELAQASLSPLPQTKVRLVYSTSSPHEILRFIRDVGIDLFDAHWAQRAAHIGVALDFRFPVVPDESAIWNDEECSRPRVRSTGKRELGHNLYLAKYSSQHTRFASSFINGARPQSTPDSIVCHCGACSPTSPSTYLSQSAADV